MAPPACESSAHGELLAVERVDVGDESHLWVRFDVEEVGGAEVLVALGLLRVEAIGVDCQLNGRLAVEVECALEAVKCPFTVIRP